MRLCMPVCIRMQVHLNINRDSEKSTPKKILERKGRTMHIFVCQFVCLSVYQFVCLSGKNKDAPCVVERLINSAFSFFSSPTIAREPR